MLGTSSCVRVCYVVAVVVVFVCTYYLSMSTFSHKKGISGYDQRIKRFRSNLGMMFCVHLFLYMMIFILEMIGPPGALGIWGEWLFIFRELGSTGSYFRGAKEQAHNFGDLAKKQKKK